MIQEGDLVLCTVDKIVGTTVFVKIEDGGEGTIITSEVAPGRIRNLRDYVIPNKKIVCKVLSTEGKNIHLSLRRVTAKERKEVMDKYAKEKSAVAILKSIAKNGEEISKKIKEKEKSLNDFFEKAKENPKILEGYLNKEELEKLLEILKERKEKEISVKKEFKMSSIQENGLILIKDILAPYKGEVIYLAAGRYLIKVIGNSYKEANHKLEKILEEIEKKAKSLHVQFEKRD